MGMEIVLVFLAAFGVLCVLWTLFGHLLPGNKGTVLVFFANGTELDAVVRYYSWLRGLGVLRSPLIIVDGALTQMQRQSLQQRQGIEICDPEALACRIEQERRKLG